MAQTLLRTLVLVLLVFLPHAEATSVPPLGSRQQSVLFDCAAIGCGAVAGALLRFSASKSPLKQKISPTLFVNVLGSFILGFSTVASRFSPRFKLGLGVGFCGSLTTFSTYSVEVVNLVENDQIPKAFAHVLGNNALSCGAAFAGICAGRGRGPAPAAFARIKKTKGTNFLAGSNKSKNNL